MIVTSSHKSTASYQNPTVRVSYAAALVLIGTMFSYVNAQADALGTDHPVMSILDGKSFTGELDGPGIPPGRTDTVVFQNGMFLSKECQLRCGYTDGPYWVRSDGDGLQFRAETPCLKADATIVWTGTVKDDEIEGTFTWTSERWYWTVEKEFSFRGRLVESGLSVAQ